MEKRVIFAFIRIFSVIALASLAGKPATASGNTDAQIEVEKPDVQVEGEVVITQADEDVIKRLLKEFKKHTYTVSLMSMPDPYFDCNAYRDLVGYGWKAVPYVIEQAAQIEAVDAYIGSALIKDGNVKTPEEVFEYNRRRKSKSTDALLSSFILEITLRELTSGETKPKSRISHGYNEVFAWIEWWQQNKNRFHFLTYQPFVILPSNDEHSLIPQIRTAIKDGLLDIYAVRATYQQIIERAAAEMNIDVFIGEHEYLDVKTTLRMKSVTFEEFLYIAGRTVSMGGFKYRKTKKGYLIGEKNTTKTDMQWLTYIDKERHFQFQYPEAWKLTTGHQPVMHYRDIFLALNSAGKDNFRVTEQQIAPGEWAYNDETVVNQLPAGSVYMDVAWWQGPGPDIDPGITEMSSDNLVSLLTETPEKSSADGQLIKRELSFHKFGKRWSIFVYLREPVSTDDHKIIKRVLESFKFDKIHVDTKQ